MDDLESQYEKETGTNAICLLDYNTLCETREFVSWLKNKVIEARRNHIESLVRITKYCQKESEKVL